MQFISSSWVTSSFVVAPYAAAIVFGIISQENKLVALKQKIKVCGKLLQSTDFVGKATYHIFLTQQLYFCIKLYDRASVGIRTSLLIDIIICMTVGCLFYWGYAKTESFVLKKYRHLKGSIV